MVGCGIHTAAGAVGPHQTVCCTDLGSCPSTDDRGSHGPTTPDSKEPQMCTQPPKTEASQQSQKLSGEFVFEGNIQIACLLMLARWDFPSHWQVPSTPGLLLSSVYMKNTSTHTYIEQCLSHHPLPRWSPEPWAWPKPGDGRGAKTKSLVSWRKSCFTFMCLVPPEQLRQGCRIAPN